MRTILFLLLLLFTINGFSQDFDLYPRFKDENINIPRLYENTLKNEFQLMSRNIRMMDAFYAAIVPGYIHFRAKDNILGYNILGGRMIGYGGLYYYYNRTGTLKDSVVYSKTDKYILWTSIGLIVGSYIYDWIHGKFRLEKKQELIRYKYSIKINLERTHFPTTASRDQSYIPQLSLNINF